MFQYLLSFLLVNTYYQSFGHPIQHNSLISDLLVDLSNKCGNVFVANAIKDKLNDCAIPTILYNTKQIRCLMFYDINQQLCTAIAASKLSLANDYKSKIVEKEDVNIVCTLAKDWVFTNLTEYDKYKNLSERLMKSPVTCGDICGVEDMNDANDFCKYYKWGIELLKAEISKPQISTEIKANNNNVEPPAISDSESNAKADIPVSVNGNSQQPQTGYTKNVQTKQSQLVIPNSAAEKPVEAVAEGVSKSTVQTASKQSITPNSGPNIGNKDAQPSVDIQKPVVGEPAVDINDQVVKPAVMTGNKPDTQNDPLLSSNDLLDVNQNDVLQNNDGNASNDGNSYGDDIDGDDEDSNPGLNIKVEPAKQEIVVKTNVPSQNSDSSQKEFYPSSDGFADDGDNFFPFFLTAVILVVLLYVLYHNKNKVSKVFFGLILEGRQSGRRRNSRGHAYRRLDTLEQAMSANTAAPPSKIIY